jgi:N6-adenosine-specific RNA methylase IME4
MDNPDAGPTPLPPGPFGCILADPPWSFLTYGKKRTTPHRGENEHYLTMTALELRELPVATVAAKDCALFMWVVGSHYDEAIELGKSWGFRFITGDVLVWCKTARRNVQFGFYPPETVHRIGMGYWSRKQSETCMLFARGKPRRLSKGVRQIIEAPRREHSRKPDEQYPRIEALVAGPYLELFARQGQPGWTAWGNQSNKFENAGVIEGDAKYNTGVLTA